MKMLFCSVGCVKGYFLCVSKRNNRNEEAEKRIGKSAQAGKARESSFFISEARQRKGA